MRTRRASLLWLILISAVGVLLGVLVSIPLLRGEGDGTQGSLVGQPAPSIAAADLDGRHWTLGDGAGRVTWVNFWATNCEPCRTEMPAMQRLADAYGDRLLILGLDWGESRQSVDDFVASYEIAYPILLDPTLDNFYRWSRLDGLPRHYFVDAHGVVVREVIGPLAPARMATILDELLGPIQPLVQVRSAAGGHHVQRSVHVAGMNRAVKVVLARVERLDGVVERLVRPGNDLAAVDLVGLGAVLVDGHVVRL